MTRKRKSQLVKSILKLIRNTFRILCLIIFLWWIAWLVSYANCVNYREAIEDEKITAHNEKTEKYQRFNGFFNKPEEKSIAEIEAEILNQIKDKVKCEPIEPIWKKEKIAEFDQDSQEIKELEGKKDSSESEKKELEEKKKSYRRKFQEARKKTIENIENQLKKNKLSITELDDGRSLWQRILHDPLNFFLVSPLNKASKLLGMHKPHQGFSWLFLEIIFKLVIVEILLLWVSYSETKIVWESVEKSQNPYLSVEEKEQLAAEAAPWFKYMFFNGFMMALFNFFLSIHPAFFDKTGYLFREKTPWLAWVFPLLFSFLISNLSVEFLRQGRLLNIQEIKNSLAKSWIISLLFVLLMLWALRGFGMNNIGSHLLIFLGGLVKFAISVIRVKFLRHKEHGPIRSQK